MKCTQLLKQHARTVSLELAFKPDLVGPVCGVPHRSPLDWIEEQHWL
ncbi:unnamed protein product [Caretta caretta]